MKLKAYPIEEKIHGFAVTKSEIIEEIQCVLTELTHEKTNAKVMHLSNDDPENIFCLSFQTFPESSNGVAHILEHTVLCGSKKYPIHDPFFSMHRRSLTTFMNAFTGADFTCYPAASQVKKDFYNLLSVYIDSVFHPLLNEYSFLQEGWRLEFSAPTNPSTPLEYKGIVFNEMKGALSSSTTRLLEAVNQNLFPDITYGYNSGGDPVNIPELSYDELLAFHQRYYHPSRCLFFFYGNMPLEDHLDFITKEALDGVEKKEALPPIPEQKRHSKAIRFTTEYPISPDEDIDEKSIVALSWLTCHILRQEEILALNVLDIILMATDASILKMALLKSGLCKQAGAFLEGDISEVPFILILKGCNPKNADQIETVVQETLQGLIKNGIDHDLIENSMHQLEFHRSEITGDGYPFGLSLFMRSALIKQHGGLPEDGLKIHSLFEKLRQDLADEPKYFEKLIQKYFIDNTHFVRVLMNPSKELALKELAEERHTLDAIRTKMSDPDITNIIERSKQFAVFQEQQKHQDIEVLPKVTLADVPKESRQYPLSHKQIGNLDVYRHNCFTNGIIYADLVFPMPKIAEEDLPFVHLFSILLGQMGCGGRSYAENLDYIVAHTGGIGAAQTYNISVKDYKQFSPMFHIRGKALHRKVDKLFPLLHEMVNSIDFNDPDRLREVIIKHHTNLESTLNTSALKYAVNLATSGLTVIGKINYQWYGLPYYWLIRDLANDFDHHVDALIAKMQQLQQQLLGLKGADLVLSCDDSIYKTLQSNHFFGLQDLKEKAFTPWNADYSVEPVTSQGRMIASPVAFTGRAFNTVPYLHADAPALMIAAHLFDNITIHTRIREQGGAYGAGASSNVIAGNFYFFAGRDPNIANSIAAFDEAVQTILSGKFDDSKLAEAKLGTIQGMDSPVAPGSRAELAHNWMKEGRTHELRQSFREKLLSLSCDDIKAAVERHIVPNAKKAITVVFAGKELLEKEKAVLQQSGDTTLDLIETI